MTEICQALSMDFDVYTPPPLNVARYATGLNEHILGWKDLFKLEGAKQKI